MLKHLCKLLGPMLALCAAARADTLNIGLISFDIFSPATSNSPQVDAFDITNFTGDPNNGGFDLPPDFPVATPLTFTLSSLTLAANAGTQIIPLGDIGPGPLSPPDSLQFPDSVLFSSATFSATLDATGLLFFDGGARQALTAQVQATLFPSIGNSLAAGTDFVPLTVDVQPLPEIGTFPLEAAGFVALLVGAQRKRKTFQAGKRS